MNCEYVRNHYQVPAEIGRRVTVGGEPGVIAEDRGAHIGVLFDRDKPNNVRPCHPTWHVEYFELGPVRKATQSQLRYKRYLEYGDSFDSFRDFLGWDAEPEHPWNRGTA